MRLRRDIALKFRKYFGRVGHRPPLQLPFCVRVTRVVYAAEVLMIIKDENFGRALRRPSAVILLSLLGMLAACGHRRLNVMHTPEQNLIAVRLPLKGQRRRTALLRTTEKGCRFH
jgi:hypothetical protein